MIILRQYGAHSKKIDALNVIEYINNHTIDGDNFMFLIRKNRGGLIKNSQDIVKICMLCERKLRHVLAINDNKISGEKIS